MASCQAAAEQKCSDSVWGSAETDGPTDKRKDVGKMEVKEEEEGLIMVASAGVLSGCVLSKDNTTSRNF